MFVTRACSSSQAVQHSEARSSCMPVFFFGDTSGREGQRPHTTWLFCLGLFLTREHVHIVQWNVGDNWVSLPCSKRQLSWLLQTKCVGYCGVCLITPCFCSNFQSYCLVWFWCHCKNSLHLAIPCWELFPCTRYLENKPRARETSHYAVQTKLSVKCKESPTLKEWRVGSEWHTSTCSM